jgi:glucokinase
MSQKKKQKVLSFDLGGTKIAAGVISSDGKIIEQTTTLALFEEGRDAVIQQLVELGNNFLSLFPEIRRIGIASAGPLDPSKGVLLDPTNFVSSKGRWGKYPIAQVLSKKLKRPVFLENDAAAAMLAEHWVGAAKGYDDAMILTLGTGLGTGIINNGKLVRCGRNLHPEAGHVIIHHLDMAAPCGCGNLGCAEAYLSGRSFTRRARTRFGNPDLTARDIAELAREGDPRALAAFDEYSTLMAIAIHNYVVIYAPEIIVFTGSFAETSDLFLKSTAEKMKTHLARRTIGANLVPKLSISKLKNHAGLIGGAFVALH